MRIAAITRFPSLAIGALLLLAATVPGHAAVEIGQSAPSLQATTMSGGKFDLAALRGKVVLIVYWATWCAPCKREIPVFEAFYKRHHGKGLEMIAISTDRGREIPKARKMGVALAYPAAVLSELTQDGFGEPDGVPITYVIDTNGIVRDKFIAVPEKLLNDVVIPLLPK